MFHWGEEEGEEPRETRLGDATILHEPPRPSSGHWSISHLDQSRGVAGPASPIALEETGRVAQHLFRYDAVFFG